MNSAHHLKDEDPADKLFAWFQDMLGDQPVHWDVEHGWQVFRHPDVVAVLADAKVFSSDVARVFNPPQPDIDFSTWAIRSRQTRRITGTCAS